MNRLLAVIWLKSRIWWHGMRSRARAADTAVAIIMSFFGAAFSIGLAVGLGVVAYVAFLDGDADAGNVGLQIVFWVMGFLAVALPVFFGLGQPAVPVARLAVFPFSRGSLYWIVLAASLASSFHLLWYPSLLAVGISVLVLHGANAALGCTVLTVFALCLVVWCNTVLQVVQRLLGRRSMRELAALIGFVLLVAASLLPAFFESQGLEPEASWLQIPESASSAAGLLASIFPPSIAARGIVAIFQHDVPGVLRGLGLLVMWIGVGVVLGYRIQTKSLLEGGGSRQSTAAAPRYSGSEKAGWLSIDRLSGTPIPVGGIAGKELHYLVRSTVGKFNIVMMPLFVIVVGALVARDMSGPFLGLDRTSLIFIGSMIYASMFSNNFLYNTFAWEGCGVRSYFISPIPPRHVVLGKNVGVWIYNLILGLECVITFSLVVGLPSLWALVSGCLAFIAALLATTTVGNFVSIAMPVPRDISKVTNSPSQTGILLSLGMLVFNAVLIGGLVAIPALLGLTWLPFVLLSAAVLLELFLYKNLLGRTGRLLLDRRDRLIEALQVAP
jgi:hypothetical protein